MMNGGVIMLSDANYFSFYDLRELKIQPSKVNHGYHPACTPTLPPTSTYVADSINDKEEGHPGCCSVPAGTGLMMEA